MYPIESYLPWFTDEERGYISKEDIRELIEKSEESTSLSLRPQSSVVSIQHHDHLSIEYDTTCQSL